MQDAIISRAFVKLLEARLRSKKTELEALSQPALRYGQRSRQVEVEHEQLQGLLTTARNLVEGIDAQ